MEDLNRSAAQMSRAGSLKEFDDWTDLSVYSNRWIQRILLELNQ